MNIVRMTNSERHTAAKAFSERWKNGGNEIQDTQTFWNDFLSNVFGIRDPETLKGYIEYEKPVSFDDGSSKRIDAYIGATKVLIEQKSSDVQLLRHTYKQSDGTFLSPMEQAKRYDDNLPYSERAKYLIVCNFQSFQIWNMEDRGKNKSLAYLTLANLADGINLFDFLVDDTSIRIARETELSFEAGKRVQRLYDLLLESYKHNGIEVSDDVLNSLNVLCVRIVFCLYAEDAGLFPNKGFYKFMSHYESVPRDGLLKLFEILNTDYKDRDPFEADWVKMMPYVNGGLFAKKVTVPGISSDVINVLLNELSDGFDWSGISPTIFGALFESTLNTETRRSGGMHYTSIENIHKVIDPLFLDDLSTELDEIMSSQSMAGYDAIRKLNDFREKLGSIVCLDPACGSGNFLTESYLSLRRLENKALARIEALKNLNSGLLKHFDLGIKVHISQFHGIEINDFAVQVAKTALWIAESQMMKETEDIVHMPLDFLPLKTQANIVEGNALRLDWNEVVDKSRLNYIMGNPPFVGARLMSTEQRDDLAYVYGYSGNGIGSVDYVTAWYCKAAYFIANTTIRCAFVSTNSITQGEQPPILWRKLFSLGVHIDFAYRTFIWSNEAKDHASVHCVIIGFSLTKSPTKILFEGDSKTIVPNINPYLLSAPDILIDSVNKPICDVPLISTGNQATDDGNYYFSPDEYQDFILKYPDDKDMLHLAYNSHGFINNKPQYCLWLKGFSPKRISSNKEICRRLENVRAYRESSTKKQTRDMAEYPTVFTEDRQPEGNYIVVPKVSGQSRRYVPMGFMTPDVICNNTIKFIPNATLYHFGILESNVHMSWMRAICGRTKSDYQYSNTIVYNNFPWPTPTDAQRAKIEKTAQAILDARALYPDASLADLYDPNTMPVELAKAHKANDAIVTETYGFNKNPSESEIVAKLMRMYKSLTDDTN